MVQDRPRSSKIIQDRPRSCKIVQDCPSISTSSNHSKSFKPLSFIDICRCYLRVPIHVQYVVVCQVLPSEKFFWVPQSEGLVVTPQKWPEFAAGFTALHIRQFSKIFPNVKYQSIKSLINICTYFLIYKMLTKDKNLYMNI